MNKTTITSLLAVALTTCVAQAQALQMPPIEWQQSFGGTNIDELECLDSTSDGGCILVGSTRSDISGNKTSPLVGFIDGWVLRLDAGGNKLWEQSLGGALGDFFTGVRQLPDQGFILIGRFGAPVGGGTNAGAGTHSQADFWVVRLDPDGHKLWERTYGGTGTDLPYDISQTADGGFILCGYSDSPPNGTKTSPGFGANDGWVVRLDAGGNKLWDRCFGGTNSDVLNSVEQTTDGGFVLAGSSQSSPSGNKSSPLSGFSDYWVVRLDALGNKLWDQSYGGSGGDYDARLQLTDDGGFILGGSSSSPPGGLKTSPVFGESDFWVIRCDASGLPLWDHSFGGWRGDYLRSLQSTRDGGFILAGTSYSEPSGNKVAPKFGSYEDSWVVRLDATGAKLWEQSFGGSNWDHGQCIRTTPEGGYLLGVTSHSAPGGNKTTPHFGFSDFWVVKLAPEPSDADGDGVVDPDDLCPDTAPGAAVDAHGCSAAQRDSDGDGVVDALDLCADTPPGSSVDAAGCSIPQLCPCDGPWKNHGQYLQAMHWVTAQFLEAGLITELERRLLLIEAARSPCGK